MSVFVQTTTTNYYFNPRQIIHAVSSKSAQAYNYVKSFFYAAVPALAPAPTLVLKKKSPYEIMATYYYDEPNIQPKITFHQLLTQLPELFIGFSTARYHQLTQQIQNQQYDDHDNRLITIKQKLLHNLLVAEKSNKTITIEANGCYFDIGFGKKHENSEEIIPETGFNPRHVTQQYRMYIMPQRDDVYELVLKFTEMMFLYPSLGETIAMIKVLIDPRLVIDNEQVSPTIIILPREGKKNAQTVLNATCDIFKGAEGTVHVPAHSQKITSLIYYEQGNPHYKGGKYKDYYEPDRIHFKANITGNKEKYYLTNPAHRAKKIQKNTAKSSK